MKMKKLTLAYILPVLLLAFFWTNALSQCEPQECPDPEENGEICPDTMPIAFINQLYSEVATIVVPLTDTTGVPLHHFTLAGLENLPTGLTWVSNAPDDEFLAGNDYCILIEGTPTVADTFYLTIVLDIYINLFGQPVYVTTIEDSTSLFMLVVDNTGLGESLASLEISGNYPNPFSDWTTIRFEAKQPAEVTFEVYSLLGERLHQEKMMAGPGGNALLYSGESLTPGTYFFVLRSGSYTSSGLMVRID
jgi:hypothetical protein